jgi:translation initiation factor IF-2
MAKVRVSDLAKQMGVGAKDLVFKLQSLGVAVEDANSSLDTETIMAVLSGKKIATRPRNVIMREEMPQAEKKKVVRPPRAIITPPKREKKEVPVEAPAPAPSGPVIPEFLAAAEAEAAEQEIESKRPKAPKAPKVAAEAAETAEAPQPPAGVEESAVPMAAAHAAPAPAEHHGPAGSRRPIGPTGPRARMAATGPRPNYQGQVTQQVPGRPAAPQQRAGAPGAARPMGGPTSRPGERPGPGAPRPMGPGGRPSPGGTRPMGPSGPRPGGPGGARPTGPGGRPAPGGRMMPSAPPPPGLATRRKKTSKDDELPEKKKTTGKRGKRAPGVVEEDTGYFTKGPFSATAVLNDELGPEATVRPLSDDEEPAAPKHAPSSRRDARKQLAPSASRVLEFKRPTGKVTLSEGVTVKELAEKLQVKASDLMKHLLMKKGLMLSINAPLGADLAREIAKELDIDAELVSFEQALEIEALEKVAANFGTAEPKVVRAPVITVMGHVDHGKTSLLDGIRETNVAEGEAGGITQHIGAYQAEKRGRKIVFLDTPGHEAFTMMRARGAKVTDIVVLVVAADDGVMPQTKEAIDHARAAKVPMVVAINKIDKPEANVERVRRELSEFGVLVEQWGGDVVSVEVSAKKRKGLDELLEMILLTADMLELKSAPESPARGVVLEAKKEVGRGIVGNVLIQDGTLKIGDAFFSGAASGRVRAMTDYRGNRLKEAGPATPVSVTGFDDTPNAGDSFLVVDEESRARMIGEIRQEKAREASVQKAQRMSLDQLFQKMQAGAIKELNIILKGDVQGSVEVLLETLRKLSGEQVKVNVLHASIGAITTNDILLASASEAIVVGFNVRPERSAAELADKEGVDVRLHTVIYELQDEIKLAMTGLLDPRFQEVFQGRAQVRNTFKLPKIGTIAGCYVTEGTIPRTAGVRLLRDNRVIFEGKIASLRHFKNDVSEVKTGFECGIGIERFQDIKVGDVIEAFKIETLAGVLR